MWAWKGGYSWDRKMFGDWASDPVLSYLPWKLRLLHSWVHSVEKLLQERRAGEPALPGTGAATGLIADVFLWPISWFCLQYINLKSQRIDVLPGCSEKKATSASFFKETVQTGKDTEVFCKQSCSLLSEPCTLCSSWQNVVPLLQPTGKGGRGGSFVLSAPSQQ